jgi:hypothetical protein
MHMQRRKIFIKICLALMIMLLGSIIIFAHACSVLPFNPTNPAASGFTNIFQDLFPGTTLNPANWCANYPSASGCFADGPTTNLNQTSSCDPAHVTVSGGAAHLLLTAEANNGFAHHGACLNSVGNEHDSGAGLQVFQPPAGATGAVWIESQITLPDSGIGGPSGGVANEPSFWMNGVAPGTKSCASLGGWPNCGEIDIAEFYTGNIAPGANGGDCTSYHHDPNDWQLTLLTVGAATARTTCTAGAYAGTHYYGLLWTNSSVTFYVDRAAVFTSTNIVASSPMYLIFFNITDSRTTAAFPTTMDIHSVNVWSHT